MSEGHGLIRNNFSIHSQGNTERLSQNLAHPGFEDAVHRFHEAAVGRGVSPSR